MPYAPIVKSAGLQSAFGADKPLVFAHNHVRDAITRKWTTTGTEAGLDITAPLEPASRICDGKLYNPSRPSNQATNVYYLNLRFASPGIDIDAALLEILALADDYDCVLQIADDGDFDVVTSNMITLFDFGTITGTRRAVGMVSNAIYSGVEFARLRFENLDDQSVPAVGELHLSELLQLSRHFNIGHDDGQLAAEVTEFRGMNRAVTRYVEAKGFSDFEARATPTGDDNYGLDDVTTFRTMHRESSYGTRPVVFVRNPNTTPRAYFGLLAPSDKQVLAGPRKRIKDFFFEEHPPFVDREA